MEIEDEATARWAQTCTSGAPWAGQFLAPVQIDMFGRFLFAVLRVTEPGGGRQRFIVRGRQHAACETLLAEATAAVGAASAEHTVPLPAVELVGAGWLEWRSDTERHITISPAPAAAATQLAPC